MIFVSLPFDLPSPRRFAGFSPAASAFASYPPQPIRMADGGLSENLLLYFAYCFSGRRGPGLLSSLRRRVTFFRECYTKFFLLRLQGPRNPMRSLVRENAAKRSFFR
jgi:hypothetical protein